MSSRREKFHAPTEALQQMGINADERINIPVEEQRVLIDQAKAGDKSSMELLISQRLRHLLIDFLSSPEVQDRHDLEIDDFVQIGALALIESVISADTTAKKFSSIYQGRAARVMGSHIASTKLVASINEYGRPTYFTNNGNENRMAEELETFSEEEHEAALNRTAPTVNVESEAYENDLSELLKNALNNLTYRERRVLELLYGLGTQRRTRLEIAKMQYVTGQRIGQIEKSALENLRSIKGTQRLYDYLEILDPDNAVNMGTKDEPTPGRPFYTHENLHFKKGKE